MAAIRTYLLTLVMSLACTAAVAQQTTSDASRTNREPAVPGLADLPLTEVPSPHGSSGFFAVHITGDGGYGTTDRGLSETLAAHGIPVVALNSLRYFWKKRTPAEAAEDLQRIMEHYRLAWHAERCIVIGYSMGADVLPFMLTRLPKSSLERIALVALLGPGPYAAFQFHLTQWFGRPPADQSLPVQAELEKLRGLRMLCFQGDEDKEAICSRLDPGLIKSVTLTGGHRIGSHYEPVAETILREVGLWK
jgi:type IV secretory pathway VirJ component